jgi:hypothetical protein
MRIGGRLTDSTFRRHNITGEDDLRDAKDYYSTGDGAPKKTRAAT